MDYVALPVRVVNGQARRGHGVTTGIQATKQYTAGMQRAPAAMKTRAIWREVVRKVREMTA